MLTTGYHGGNRGTAAPRSIVRLDGHETFFNSWTVNLNSNHQADDYTIELPFKIAQAGPQTYLVNSPDNTSYLFTQKDVLVEVFVGYPKNMESYTTDDLTRIMYGYMDQAQIDLNDQGEKVTLNGRNMVAYFLDNKTTDKYQNMTSSAIAEMFAQNHGLKTAITQTYTLAGTYYNNDTVNLGTDITEWDLLTFLAQQEGFTICVLDDTLFFGSFEDLVARGSSVQLNYTWGQNIQELTLTKSPHAAQSLIVEVHSYDASAGKHVKATAKRLKTYATTSYTERYYEPGLNQDQAQKRAEAILNEISMLEVIGVMKTSGNENFTQDQMLSLYGVGIGLSDQYYIRQARHTFNNYNQSPEYSAEVTFSNLLLQDQNTGGI